MSLENNNSNHDEYDEHTLVTVCVTDNNNKKCTYKYLMRGLQDDKEIHSWSSFCASVFSYKANPPPSEYFERHYYNDPHRLSSSLIRVMILLSCEEEESEESNNDTNNTKPIITTETIPFGSAPNNDNLTIVSSCRIFPKQIRIQNKNNNNDENAILLRAGGIGEVCTDEHHRRRGLSKLLLLDCLRIMKHLQMDVSLLHAAPNFFPVYRATGNYQCVRSEWTLVPFTFNNNNDDNNNFYRKQRLASFPSDTPQLMKLHNMFHEQHNIVGSIVRTKEYWNDYMSQELKDKLWVLEEDNNNNTIIVAWGSIRVRGDRFQLQEFGCDTTKITTTKALEMLLPQLVQSLSPAETKHALLHLPTFLFNQIKTNTENNSNNGNNVKWLMNESQPEDDLGWMYTDPAAYDKKDNNNNDENNNKSALEEKYFKNNCNHIIWPSDSF